MLATFTLTGTYHSDWRPCSGKVVATPSHPIVDEADDVVIEGPYVAILDTEGSFSLELPTQENLYYNIKVALDSIGYEQFPLAPGAADQTLDMSDVQPIEDVPFTPLLVTQATEAREEAQAAATSATESAVTAQTAADAAAVSEFNADASADLAQTAATTATAASDNATTKAGSIPAMPVIATSIATLNPSGRTDRSNYFGVWYGAGTPAGSWERFNSGGPDDKPYLHATWTTAPTSGGGFTYSHVFFPAGSQGKIVRYAAWVRSSVACTISPSVWEYKDPGSTSIGNSGNVNRLVSVPANTWTLVRGQSTIVSAEAVKVQPRFYISGTSLVAGSTMSISTIVATLNEELPPFFDGDTVGAKWTGTPGSSTSQLVMARQVDLLDRNIGGTRADNAFILADSMQTSGWKFTTTRFTEGVGSPENVVSTPVGSRYIDTAATNGAIEWIRATASGSAGGWKVVYGDTGWRDISSLHTYNEITFSGSINKMSIKRENNRVYFRFRGVPGPNKLGTPRGALFNLFVTPTGFNSSDNYMSQGVGSLVYTPGVISNWGTGSRMDFRANLATSNCTDQDVVEGKAEWSTTDQWPALLPGTAM